MLHSNANIDRLKKNHFNDSIDRDDRGVDGRFDSDSSEKIDRLSRKRNAEARRRYETIREELQLKALIDGDRWF
jgi:hypothetical protein